MGEAVEKDLGTLSGLMKTDPRLSEFLLDPSVKKGLKVDGLTGACDKLGFSELTKNLLLAMADNNRVPYIDAVATSYATLMAAHRGEIVCTVTTAKPSVKKGLKVDGLTGACDKLGFSYAIDPTIVGGMVVAIGDKFVDMSMSSKLNKYSELIKGAA